MTKMAVLRRLLLMITTIRFQWYYTHPIDLINGPNHLKYLVSSYSIIRINGRQNS